MQFKASSDYSQKPKDSRLEGDGGLVGGPMGGGGVLCVVLRGRGGSYEWSEWGGGGLMGGPRGEGGVV
jgi:hypothetical protein